jgi:hypothetical protein
MCCNLKPARKNRPGGWRTKLQNLAALAGAYLTNLTGLSRFLSGALSKLMLMRACTRRHHSFRTETRTWCGQSFRISQTFLHARSCLPSTPTFNSVFIIILSAVFVSHHFLAGDCTRVFNASGSWRCHPPTIPRWQALREAMMNPWRTR